MKKGSRKDYNEREKKNMALKSVETQNVEFKSNCCKDNNAI
jgi:hypothetical protein